MTRPYNLERLHIGELFDLLAAYTKLQSQCFHVLCRRGVSEKELTRIMETSVEDTLDSLNDPYKSERSAYSFLKYIAAQALDPVYPDDDSAELTRLKRYLIVGSMACVEAGDLDDDLGDDLGDDE